MDVRWMPWPWTEKKVPQRQGWAWQLALLVPLHNSASLTLYQEGLHRERGNIPDPGKRLQLRGAHHSLLSSQPLVSGRRAFCLQDKEEIEKFLGN